MREEINGLRDRVEEEVWARTNLEKKIQERRVEGESGGERIAAEDWKKELKEVEERITKKVGEQQKAKEKRRCIVFTDSNGRNATTPESIKYRKKSF